MTWNLKEVRRKLNPKVNQENCEHEFEFKDNWREGVYFDINCLRIPIKCIKCGLEAEETWTESQNTDIYTGEEI